MGRRPARRCRRSAGCASAISRSIGGEWKPPLLSQRAEALRGVSTPSCVVAGYGRTWSPWSSSTPPGLSAPCWHSPNRSLGGCARVWSPRQAVWTLCVLDVQIVPNLSFHQQLQVQSKDQVRVQSDRTGRAGADGVRVNTRLYQAVSTIRSVQWLTSTVASTSHWMTQVSSWASGRVRSLRLHKPLSLVGVCVCDCVCVYNLCKLWNREEYFTILII